MANKDVKFTFEGTGMEDLEVYINDNRVAQNENNKGSFEGKVSDSEPMKVLFEISGENGQDYSIKYTCKSNGGKKEDTDKPSPIEGTIDDNGYTEEQLTINI